MEANSLFDKLKTREEVVKVIDCTYSRDKKEDEFYLCNCKSSKNISDPNSEEFLPICKACMIQCHKEEEGHITSKHSGRYECKCGEHKHETRIITSDEKKKCIYSKLQSINGKLKVYKVDEKNLCEFCIEKNCGSINTELGKTLLNENYDCHCEEHETIGVLNLEKTSQIVASFRDGISNFNINFLLIDKELQEKTIIYLLNKLVRINDQVKDKKDKAKENFFIDYKLFKILRCFHELRKEFKDRHTTFDLDTLLKMNEQPFARLDKNNIRDVGMELLKKEPKENLLHSEFLIFSELKLLFAEFIYYLCYHSFFTKFNNNSLKLNVISGMNLFQRYIYIHEFKNFYKFSQNENSLDVTGLLDDLQSYVNVVIFMFDKLLDRLDESVDLQTIERPFKIYLAIIKKLIKRGLLDNDNIKTFFEIIYKTLKKLKDTDQIGFSLPIISCIYYVLLLNNDKFYLNSKYQKKYGSVNLSSTACDQNNLINKILFKILNPKLQNYFYCHNGPFTIIINKIVIFYKKIIDLSIGDKRGNIIAIQNMQLNPDYKELLKSEDVHYAIKKMNLNLEEDNKNSFFNPIRKTTTKLSEINEKYIHYNYDHNHAFEKYYKDFKDIMRELKFEINKELKSVPQIKTHVFLIDTEQSSEENTFKINQIKQAIKYTNFLQAVNGFLKNFAERKEYLKNNQKNFTLHFKEKDYLKNESNSEFVSFLFRIIYMFIKEDDNKNLENLILLNFLDVRSFMITFEDNKNYMDFITNINQLYYGKINQYFKFENDGFIVKLTNRLILDCDFHEIKNELLDDYCNYNIDNNFGLKNFEKVTLAMRIVTKMIRHVTLEECENLQYLQLIQSVLIIIFDQNNLKERLLLKVSLQSKLNKMIQEFLYRLFNLLNEVNRSDCKFYKIINPDYFLTLEDINDNYLNNRDLKVELIMGVKEYLAHLNYYIKYDFFNTSIPKMYRYPEVQLNLEKRYQGYYSSRENFNLSNLADYEQIKPFNLLSSVNTNENPFHREQMREKIEKFTEDYLNLDNFKRNILDEVEKIESLMRRRIILIRYFENAIMRPTYSLINSLLVVSGSLEGFDMHLSYEMIKAFFICFKDFIYNISKSDSLKDSQKEVDSYKHLDLENQELLFYPPNKIEFYNSVKNFADFEINNIKYFEFLKYVNKFFDFVDKYTSEENNNDNNKNYNKLKKKELIELEKLNKDLNCKILDIENSIIKTIKDVDSEEVNILGRDIIAFTFFLPYYKLNLIKYEIEEKILKEELDNRSNSEATTYSYMVGLSVVWQQFSISFVNKFFHLDFLAIQEIFQYLVIQNYWFFLDNFFITINMSIHSISVFESIKFYEIKRFYGKESLTLSQCCSSIKILQNFCEGHNSYFQNLLFQNVYVYQIEGLGPNEHEYFNFKPKFVAEEHLNNSNNIALFKFNKKSTTEEIIKYFDINEMAIEEFLESYEPLNVESNPLVEFIKKEGIYDVCPNIFKFSNFLFVQIRMMIYHSNLTSKCYDALEIKQISDSKGVTKIRESLENLLLEMVQGSSELVFKKIYNDPENKELYSTISYTPVQDFYPNNDIENFSFLKYILEIRNLYNYMTTKEFVIENNVNFKSTQIIYNFFKFINTIISQQKKNDSLIYKVTKHFFPIESLISTSMTLMKVIYKKYSKKEEKNQEHKFENILKEIMDLFKNDLEVFKDPLFKLPAEIFLFLTIISEKFDDEDAIKHFDFKIENNERNDDNKCNNKIEESESKKTNKVAPLDNNYEPAQLEIDYNKDFEKEILEREIYDLNKKQTIIFFKNLIRKVEFIIKNAEGKPTNKIIYFLTNPKTYDISEDNLSFFFENVDRSSPTIKLKSLVAEINLFSKEIDVKGQAEYDENRKKMLEFDYKNVHKVNFFFGGLINIFLLLFLIDVNFFDSWYHIIIVSVSLIQIAVNLYFIYFFFSTKYNYILLIETARVEERLKAKNKKNAKEQIKKDVLKFKDKVEIYLWRTILNEDMALLYFNVIILVVCLLNKYSLFLYPFLLFSILKFNIVIREIVLAFQSSFKQLLEMIGFLAILIYFYANFGFFFMNDEFNLTLDSGEQTNMCSSLLECFILYFNFGIRAGGGIGDVLGPKAYSIGIWFWVRWVTDMIFFITVILLIMNMINGIIITTFSTRRQALEEITEDQENKCFICSRSLVKFLAKSKDFKAHIKNEHNYKDYVRYFLMINSTDSDMLDSDQSNIKQCIEQDDVAFFPVAKSIYFTDDVEEDEDKDDTEVEEHVEEEHNEEENNEEKNNEEKNNEEENNLEEYNNIINENQDTHKSNEPKNIKEALEEVFPPLDQASPPLEEVLKSFKIEDFVTVDYKFNENLNNNLIEVEDAFIESNLKAKESEVKAEEESKIEAEEDENVESEVNAEEDENVDLEPEVISDEKESIVKPEAIAEEDATVEPELTIDITKKVPSAHSEPSEDFEVEEELEEEIEEEIESHSDD